MGQLLSPELLLDFGLSAAGTGVLDVSGLRGTSSLFFSASAKVEDAEEEEDEEDEEVEVEVEEEGCGFGVTRLSCISVGFGLGGSWQ